MLLIVWVDICIDVCVYVVGNWDISILISVCLLVPIYLSKYTVQNEISILFNTIEIWYFYPCKIK